MSMVLKEIVSPLAVDTKGICFSALNPWSSGGVIYGLEKGYAFPILIF